jgi:hypothetical protein
VTPLQIRPRFGDQHVAGNNRHAAFELRERPGHPGVHRQHHAVCANGAVAGLNARWLALLQPGHRGVFVNLHAQLQRHLPQAAHQFARLHTGRRRGKPSLQMLARTGHALHVGDRTLGERVDAVALKCSNHRIGRAALGLIGRSVERAIETVIGLNAVLFAEGANRVNAALGFLDQAHGFFDAEQPLQGEILGRPRQRTTAVAATGASTADVGLDQHHLEFRVLLLEHDRRPQTGVAATDDAHVCTGIAVQRRTGVGRISL